ncbi:LysM peptidoglycan-binding domain-containing protein [Brevibacillus sp. SYP-B805]|uniref:LysM peptidoglycan-binding domain-containing protein n=1 Tax=Brevibacillus sp. SYP-B805 TaxID=1578199 RepID=UPI0013EBF1CD|nr:LysM peptidoglycan-binding domain-containing protein [Brevibacillus sp. SYP-B805]
MNYRVQPGDTLIGIASRFGVPVEEIIRVNNLQYPYRLFVGQTIFIPTGRPPTPGNVNERLDRLDQRVNRLENRVDRLERQVVDLNRRVTRLEGPRPRT